MAIRYDPPVFIEQSEAILTLKNYILNDAEFCTQTQHGHVMMAFDLLSYVLHKMYGNTSFDTLVKRSSNIRECELFSSFAREYVKHTKWKPNTMMVVFSVLKRILLRTSISRSFIKRLSLSDVVIVDKCDLSNIVPSRYKNITEKSVIDRLTGWIHIIQTKTKNKSPLSVRQIVYFLLNSFLKVLDYDVETMQIVPEFELKKEQIKQMCGKNEVARKLSWIKLFCENIFNQKLDEKLLDPTNYTEKTDRKFKLTKNDNSDTHRISAIELEQLYDAIKSEESVRNELIFLLLITTGMRVGGLVNILLEHVISINGSDVVVKQYGRTIEKGNKWFSFSMTPSVQSLIKIWVSGERKSVDSPYLFPSSRGNCGHLGTGTVRIIFENACKKGNLTGDHLHVHSLRHSFAHMLLESGNSVDIVSKMLGHSNTQTTESYYLKENAIDVSKRANVPWLTPINKEKVVPDFLIEKTSQKTEKRVSFSNREERVKRLRGQKLLEFLSRNEQENQSVV